MVAIGNLTLADTLTYQDGDTNGYSHARQNNTSCSLSGTHW